MVESNSPARVLDPVPRRFTITEYYRAAERGIIGPSERVQLIEGEIVQMSPQKSRHAGVTGVIGKFLERAFGRGHCVRIQMPLALFEHSEPEPDVAVVVGGHRDYMDAHPTTALLVVEVADTTVAFDRDRKAPLYARAGIPEYWLADLPRRTIAVYRDPDPGRGRYRSVTHHREGSAVSPLRAPRAPRTAVRDLLS